MAALEWPVDLTFTRRWCFGHGDSNQKGKGARFPQFDAAD